MRRSSMKPHLRFHTGLWWCSTALMPGKGEWRIVAHSSATLAYLAWKEGA